MDRWIDEGQRERQRNLKRRILCMFMTAAPFKGFQETHWSLGLRHSHGPRGWHVKWRVPGEGDPEDLERWLRQVLGEKHKAGTHQALRWHPRAGSVFRRVLPPLEPRNLQDPDTVTPLQEERSLGPQMLPHPLSAPVDKRVGWPLLSTEGAPEPLQKGWSQNKLRPKNTVRH